MTIRKFALPAIGLSFALAMNIASAQTNPNKNQNNTQQTTPAGTTNAQQDSINRMRQQESAQDKSVIRQEQRGTTETGQTVQQPTMRDNTTKDNLSPDDAKRAQNDQRPDQVKQETKTEIKDGDTKTQVQSKTTEKTMPSGTTVTDSKTKIKTQEPGQAPDRTMIKKRTITTPDGKTIEKEFYNDFEVLRDDDGRRYYMDKQGRVYFPEEKEEMGAGEPTRSDLNKDMNNKTRDDRNPNNTSTPNGTNQSNTPKK